jgi:hypothetical protein
LSETVNALVVERKSLIRVLTASGLAAGIVLTWLANRPPTTDCDKSAEPRDNARVFIASTVVAQPWYGRHRVYGVFTIPDQHGPADVERVTVLGSHVFAVTIEEWNEDPGKSIVRQPGYRVLLALVPTRLALWFLITGRFGDLAVRCNWILVLPNDTPPNVPGSDKGIR